MIVFSEYKGTIENPAKIIDDLNNKLRTLKLMFLDIIWACLAIHTNEGSHRIKLETLKNYIKATSYSFGFSDEKITITLDEEAELLSFFNFIINLTKPTSGVAH